MGSEEELCIICFTALLKSLQKVLKGKTDEYAAIKEMQLIRTI